MKNFVVHDFFCRDGRREWSLFDKFLSGLASNWHETRFSRHFVSMHPSNWHETRFSSHFVSPQPSNWHETRFSRHFVSLHLSPSKKTASTRKLWRFHQIKIMPRSLLISLSGYGPDQR